MRAPNEITKDHAPTDAFTQALINGASSYRVAGSVLEAWDALPRSVQVAICMEYDDLLSALTPAPAQEGPDKRWPPQCCTAWEDCKIDGICHDPEYCASVGPNARNFEGQAND